MLPDAAVAQLVEHLIRNEGVGGSSPFRGTIIINDIACIFALVLVTSERRGVHVPGSARVDQKAITLAG